MKIVKTLLIATLLTNIGVMAMTTKIKDENKVVYEVLQGDSKDKYMKPGLAVDLSYKSEHVSVGQVSDVNITITTSLVTGILKVKLKSLEEDKSDFEEQDLEFKLSKDVNSFPINLALSSAIEGRHYITVFISLEGEGGRVFEVPLNIGNISEKLSTTSVEITDEGIAVTSSAAEEEIK